MPSSSLDPGQAQENLEPLGKDAGLTENICTTFDAPRDVEMPQSSTEAFITPVEKEREVARKKEQERRRREAVSARTRVDAWGWSQEHLNISSFLQQISGIDITRQWDVMTSFELNLD